MSIREFFDGSGKVVFEERKISLRTVKEGLKKNFRVVVLEETAQSCKCEIVRFAAFYRNPGFLFNPTMDLHIEKENTRTTIRYNFSRPEFRWVIVASALFAVLASILDSKLSGFERIMIGATSFLFGLGLFGLVVFVDTKLVSSRIRKVLMNLEAFSKPDSLKRGKAVARSSRGTP
jgi:hypothetical protein